MNDSYINCNIKEAHIYNFIEEYSFATIMIQNDDINNIAQIPFYIDFDTNHVNPKVYFHIPKSNCCYEKVAKPTNITCLFSGPYTYLSPHWFQTMKAPTWNFKNVIICGSPIMVDSKTALLVMSRKMMHYEIKTGNKDFSIESAYQYLEKEIDEIAVFEIEIKSIQSNFKLSQHEDEKTILNIIRELKKQDNYNSMLIAFEMEQELRKKRSKKAIVHD